MFPFDLDFVISLGDESEQQAARFHALMREAAPFLDALKSLPNALRDDVTARQNKKLYARAHRIVRRDRKRALGRHDRIATELRGAS